MNVEIVFVRVPVDDGRREPPNILNQGGFSTRTSLLKIAIIWHYLGLFSQFLCSIDPLALRGGVIFLKSFGVWWFEGSLCSSEFVEIFCGCVGGFGLV